MADSDKNIVLTTATGTSSKPNIEFTGKDNNTPLQLRTLDDGSLQFIGGQGALLTVSDSYTGTLFAASDVSGVPGIDFSDTGLVRLAPHNGQVIIGYHTVKTTAPASNTDMLQVTGNAYIEGGVDITGAFSASSANIPQIDTARLVVTNLTPASNSAAGTTNQIIVDDDYIYVRTSSEWKRVALTTF